MIQSVLTEERPITQEMETRHLVHTWSDTDVLESAGTALQPFHYIPVLPVLHLFGKH